MVSPTVRMEEGSLRSEVTPRLAPPVRRLGDQGRGPRTSNSMRSVERCSTRRESRGRRVSTAMAARQEGRHLPGGHGKTTPDAARRSEDYPVLSEAGRCGSRRSREVRWVEKLRAKLQGAALGTAARLQRNGPSDLAHGACGTPGRARRVAETVDEGADPAEAGKCVLGEAAPGGRTNRASKSPPCP